jgi:transposase
LFYAEHWKIGTIAGELNVHPDAVRHAIETGQFNRAQTLRPCLTDPYLEFIQQTLQKHPRLRATRIHHMIQERGYAGSVVQLRRVVARLRPAQREAFLRLRTFPGEQAQVDWAQFGEVAVGRARRRLSCFLITLSYARALYLEFFFDQTMENFLRGHVHAFQAWSGQPRIILYDNLRSVVLERRGDQIHFHPRLLDLCSHYHFAARPCQVRAGNQKGRVERAVRYVRESFWAGRPFTTLEEWNRQALLWRDQVAHQRPWPGDDSRTVEQAFTEEKLRLLPLPAHPFETDLVLSVHAGKTIYIRFDLNDYSLPPQAVGRPLTLVASESSVRILEGTKEIARHRRSYDRHQLVLDPAHQEALLEEKRKAFGSTPGGRLRSRFPNLLKTLVSESNGWSRWSREGRAQGRRTTRLRYAPTLLSLDSSALCEFASTARDPDCARTVPESSGIV